MRLRIQFCLLDHINACFQDIIYSTRLSGLNEDGQVYSYQQLQQVTFTPFSTVVLANNVSIQIFGGLRMLCDVSADAGMTFD